MPRKAHLLHVYNVLVRRGDLKRSPTLDRELVTKSSKSQSGVLVITVLTSPYPEVGGKRQPVPAPLHSHSSAPATADTRRR